MMQRDSQSRCRWRGAAVPVALLCLVAWMAPPAAAQSVSFGIETNPNVVLATTGLSEVLGEIILTATPACGTSADTLCLSSASTIQVRFTNVTIDNSVGAGMQVCETIGGNFECNAAGNLMSGVTVTTDSILIGIRDGVDIAAGDQITIGGVRARIATGFLASPGVDANVVVSANPPSAASFPSDTLVVGQSADPLILRIFSVPQIPCAAGDAIPTAEIIEGYPSAFVDYGDPLERSFPGAPVPGRPALGGNTNTRVSVTLSGMAPGVQVEWPLTVPAQNSASALDLISTSADGATATYIYGTPNQSAADQVAEIFAIRLNPINFSFSGTDELSGIVSLQTQLLPPATPDTLRPRYDHPLQPVPAEPYFLLQRCATAPTPVGKALVHAEVDGLPWSGTLNYQLQGPVLSSGTGTPDTVSNLPVGVYLATYLSGGPAGATFTGISPANAQNVTSAGTTDYTFDFTGPTIANLQLSATSSAACPSANTPVGSFELVNATSDVQIIPSHTTLTIAFSKLIATAPAVSGLGNIQGVVGASEVTYSLPDAISLPPGGMISFSGAQLNLNGVANGQDVTVLVTAAPAAALQLNVNQVTVATANTAQCVQPPLFSANGVTNGASFVPGVTAGAITTLFGTHLSNLTGINLTSGLPLPPQLQGTFVTVNGIQAPLFAVDNVSGQEQINFQVPWELAQQPTAAIVVNNNGVLSDPVTINVQAALPGTFTTDGTTGAILHGIGLAPVTQANPAASGETVLLFATGLGPVSNTPATGAAAGSSPTSESPAKPLVTIGGIAATVDFSGLAPGFVGLYQLNVEIPSNAPSGSQDVVIQIGSQSSKPVKINLR